MATNSNIEWTDATWNPVVGCTKVSPGCAHCYAETMAGRLKAMALKDIEDGKDPGRKRNYIDAIDDKGRWSGKLIPVEESLDDPMRWRKPRRVFVNSMSDLFHKDVPYEFIDRVFAVMALCPHHTFQVLTKRAERLNDFMLHWITESDPSGEWRNPLPNVWLGVSVERQQEADERIPWLLKAPAAVRFLSCEPLLGAIDLQRACSEACPNGRQCIKDEQTNHRIVQDSSEGGIWVECACSRLGGLHGVIVGGESGPGSRPLHIEWARSLRDQCQSAGVPFFFKQWGAWEPLTEPIGDGVIAMSGGGKRLRAVELDGKSGPSGGPGSSIVRRVGKKAAGRDLDGREWNELPTPARQES